MSLNSNIRDEETISPSYSYAWGKGLQFQLGTGATRNRRKPTAVKQLTGRNIMQVSCGTVHTLFLSEYGKVLSVGVGFTGALGHGSKRDQEYPKQMALLHDKTVLEVAAGPDFSLALTAEGDVYGWGMNIRHQLGIKHGKNTKTHPLPRLIEALVSEKIVSIACAGSHSAACSNRGSLFTWGMGTLGYDAEKLEQGGGLPLLVSSLKDDDVFVSKVGVGVRHMAALDAKGRVYEKGREKEVEI